MAKYSDNREQNLEAKYLHKIWSRVDSGVELPKSLTGDALLPLLDDIPTHKPVSREIRFSPKVFSWKSGVTYAAAFVLIVALSAFLGRNNGVRDRDLVREGITPIQPSDTSPPVEMDENGQPDIPAADLPEQTGAETSQQAAVTVPATQPEDTQSTAQAGVPSAQTEDPGRSEEDPATAAIGGQSRSVELTREGEYTYTYRSNDSTDPDKLGYPITVNILHTSSGVLAFAIDIPDMLQVDRCFVSGNTVTLIGQGEEGVALHAYDLSNIAQAEKMDAFVQPGALLEARLQRNYLHLFTYLPSGEAVDGETVVLPDSTGDSACVVTAVDIETMEREQVTFVGAGDDLRFFGSNAYLQYAGEETEDNERGAYVAHIRLDGLQMELREDREESPQE